jgi:hypothetical protein
MSDATLFGGSDAERPRRSRVGVLAGMAEDTASVVIAVTLTSPHAGTPGSPRRPPRAGRILFGLSDIVRNLLTLPGTSNETLATHVTCV